VEDAASEDDVKDALAAGSAVAQEEIDNGAQLLVAGDLTVDDVRPTAVIAAALGLSATEVMRPERGVTNDLHKNTAVIDAALVRLGDRMSDPLATLSALGGADLAACTGYLCAAAQSGIPVLVDGIAPAACAILADRFSPGAARWFVAGNRAADARGLAYDTLGLLPIMPIIDTHSGKVGDLPMLAAVGLLRTATALLTTTASFSDCTDRRS
jgi:nicotinate-nucleotide--dimethylbenzimidazole phosphoribosyltransferase